MTYGLEIRCSIQLSYRSVLSLRWRFVNAMRQKMQGDFHLFYISSSKTKP